MENYKGKGEDYQKRSFIVTHDFLGDGYGRIKFSPVFFSWMKVDFVEKLQQFA